MGFSRQEYWSGLPFPSPGTLPDPGISCIAGRRLTFWATRETLILRSIPLKMPLAQVTLGNKVLNKDKQGVLGLFKSWAALRLWYGHLSWISLGDVVAKPASRSPPSVSWSALHEAWPVESPQRQVSTRELRGSSDPCRKTSVQKHVCVQLCLTLSWPHGQSARLPCLWDPPGKKTRVHCHSLLQGIFLTQESNLGLLHLLHWQALKLYHCTTWEAHVQKKKKTVLIPNLEKSCICKMLPLCDQFVTS